MYLYFCFSEELQFVIILPRNAQCFYLDDWRSIGLVSLSRSREVSLSLSQSKAAVAWIILIQDFQLPGPIVTNSQLVNQIEKLKRADLNWKRRMNLKLCYKIRGEFYWSLSFIHRLEDECLRGGGKSNKLKMKLKSEVNLITFNSSLFSGSSLHCHLGQSQSIQARGS